MTNENRLISFCHWLKCNESVLDSVLEQHMIGWLSESWRLSVGPSPFTQWVTNAREELSKFRKVHSNWFVCDRATSNLDHLMVGLGCIAMHRAFRMLCGEREVLEVAMLSLRDVRAETLERPINSNQVTRRKRSFPLRFPLMRFRNISVKTDSLRKRNELYKRCSSLPTYSRRWFSTKIRGTHQACAHPAWALYKKVQVEAEIVVV